MSALQRPLTYDDLLEMPDDGMRREVIGGELIVNPAPTPDHQRVLRSIFRLVDAHVEHTGTGETFFAPIDVLLGRFNVVQPDLVVIARNQGGVVTSRGIEGPPILVVEVISPRSSGIDHVRKMALYASAGVREYWLVDPEGQSLQIYTLDGDDLVAIQPDIRGVFASVVLAGLSVDPADLFSGLG